MTEAKHKPMRSRTRDFLLYVLIGLLVVAAAILCGIYYVNPATAGKWIDFAIMSAFIFGNAIRYSKSLWTLRRFWWALASFLLVHLIVGFAVLKRFPTVRLIDFVVVGVAEYLMLNAYLGRALAGTGESPK